MSSDGNAPLGSGVTTTNIHIGEMHIAVRDEGPSSSAENAVGGVVRGGEYVVLDFMPIETDCDSQGAHLRKILKRGGRFSRELYPPCWWIRC